MQPWWLIPIVGAFILSVLLTDVVRDLANRWGIVDRANKDRKVHKGAMPMMGGVAIYFAFSFVVATVLLTTDHFTMGEITDMHFIGFLFGGWILIIGGILDDQYELPPKLSIIFPILASLVAVVSGIGVSKITNPFGEPFEIGSMISSVFTFIWLMGMIYTTKLLDGLDGLATGVSAIGALMISLLALSAAFYQPDVALVSLIVLAVLIGFLMWNFNPAAIFLGEGGSTFVGYLVGVLAVISGSKVATALLVIGIPALDVGFVLFDRMKRGKPIFSGDGSHLHHKLLASGLSHRQVVLLYYAIAIGFGVTTLIFSSWQKLLALSVLFVIMLILVKKLSQKRYES